MQINKMTRIALFTALLAIISPLSIPLAGEVPISMATLGVMLAGLLLGPRDGAFVVGLYLLLGFVGLPVFANYSGGPSVLFGVTGGFLFGYVLLAYFSGFVYSKNKAIPMSMLGMAIGNVLLYASGTLWFMALTHMSLWQSLVACVLPFLPGDFLKMLAASLIAKRLSPVLDRYFS